MHKNVYPFSAIVGQEKLKLSLILNAINPQVGGVLIRGEKGTAKSTAVRALAALLPEIKVVQGCPYSCDPDQQSELCEKCREKRAQHREVWRRTKVITLPLNATEDRVAGGIDFDLAIKKGIRVLQPGLLAKAHRGILYVDEVNLLDDHIVDIILDAAACGENRIEREGISYRHPARFILSGTMNPEEGELRPQLLDRFGLCVEVTAEADLEKRALLMQYREEYDLDPRGFQERFREENEKIAARIIHAREILGDVRLPRHLRLFISELSTQNHAAGHRADLVMEQAAKAHAAYHDRFEVTIDDISETAPMVLLHRKRDEAPAPPPPPPPAKNEEQEKSPEDENPNLDPMDEQQNDSPQESQPPPEEADSRADDAPPPPRDDGKQDPMDPEEKEGEREMREQVFEVGATFRIKHFEAPKDRVVRRGSGRRSRTRISQKQGRYVKSTMKRGTGDIALDATLRAAAPYQQSRKGNGKLAVYLKDEDIREKIREKRIGNFLLFVADASGSMGARSRMAASKGAIMSLLLDAYQKRDRVAMISFRKREAVLNLPPTSSVELAGRLLKEMPVGGRTPLSAGLVKCHEILRNQFLRDPSMRPFVIFITDGKSNVALGEGKPVEEALDLAARMSLDPRVQFIVVDTEEDGVVSFGLARQLAAAMHAQYFKIDDLKADQLVNVVKGTVQ
jgi:magnesium chelatase subunit D